MISAVATQAVAVANGRGVSRENSNTAKSTSARPAPPTTLFKSADAGAGKNLMPSKAPRSSSQARNGVRKNAHVGVRVEARTAAANDSNAPVATRAFRRLGQNR